MILGLLCYLLIAMGMGIWLEELQDKPDMLGIPSWGIVALAMFWPFVIFAMLLLMMFDGLQHLLGGKR